MTNNTLLSKKEEAENKNEISFFKFTMLFLKSKFYIQFLSDHQKKDVLRCKHIKLGGISNHNQFIGLKS